MTEWALILFFVWGWLDTGQRFETEAACSRIQWTRTIMQDLGPQSWCMPVSEHVELVWAKRR